MIASLNGVLLESEFTRCVIECGGVGYDVAIAMSTFDRLPRPGKPVRLLIHTQLREDAVTLYGFATAEERTLFRELINVTGIGGKLALNILGAMPASSFCAAVAAGDIKALSRINGIGRRTAERMVVELRDKLSALPGAAAAAAPATATAAADAAMALEQLGFKRDAINRVLNTLLEELSGEETSSEKLLRAALARLNC